MNKSNLPEEIELINRELLNSNIREYMKPVRIKSIFQLGNTLIPFFVLLFLSTVLINLSLWIALPFIFISSGFMIRTFIIFHDCGHKSFFKSQKANRYLGIFTGLITFTPYHFWTASHNRHHSTSGNLDKRGYGDIWIMTAEEFRNASRMNRIKYRLYRNPLVMFLLGPLFITLIIHRFPISVKDKKERNSIYLTNIFFLLIMSFISLAIGSFNFIIVYLLVLYFGLIGGIWLFYVQHQFENVYWARSEKWNFIEASLKGGSYYKLPKVINWFTGNIGYHHVHHLISKIPNYNLPYSHKKSPINKIVKPVKLFNSLKSLKFRLWDEQQGRLVSFKEARKISGRIITL